MTPYRGLKSALTSLKHADDISVSAYKSLASYQQLRFLSSLRPHILPETAEVPRAKSDTRPTVTLLTGDGIGPEMMNHVKTVFKAAKVPIDFGEITLNSSDLSNDALENAIASIQRNGVALKGNVETKFDDPMFVSRNVELRRRLDLYANVLHCVSIPAIKTRHNHLDLVMIRENIEGEYSGLEHESVKGVVESLKIVSRKNIDRIAKFAFDYAILNKRKKITVIHKANIQKLADGLFLKVCDELANSATYKGRFAFETMIVDNASMQLVSRPQQFNDGVLLMPNLYGNIISNIACGLVGGPGLVSGMNLGSKYAVFETGTRSTGTSLIGSDTANPTAFLRASVDMLRYLRLDSHADRISDAIYEVLNVKKIHTSDIGGQRKSSEVVKAVIDSLK